MVMVKVYNINSIKFGTTERVSNKKLHDNGFRVMNCSYFIRPYEPTPNELGSFLLQEAKDSKKVEMKVWGCSDLSSFIAKKIAIVKEIGIAEFNKLFGKVELVDIDKEIVKRAKKGLIGATNNDFKDFKEICNINLEEYLTPQKNLSNFFLKGEPNTVLSWNESEAKFIEQEVKPYLITKPLMKGMDIRTGDIRTDLLNMKASKDYTKRILEFSNSWYFLPPEEHVKIAYLLSEKTKIGDIMLIGSVEFEHNIDRLLEVFGFKPDLNLIGVFKKVKQLSKNDLYKIKSAIEKFHIKL